MAGQLEASLGSAAWHSLRGTRVWETLRKVTTELVDETEVERTRRWMDEGLSEEELALNKVADALHADENATATDQEEDGFEVTLDPCDIGNGGEEPDDETASEPAEPDYRMDTEMVTVIVGKKRRLSKVRRAAVNPLGFTDVYQKGVDMLSAKNLKHVRNRKQKRHERNRAMRKEVYEEMEGLGNDTSQIREAFDRLYE